MQLPLYYTQTFINLPLHGQRLRVLCHYCVCNPWSFYTQILQCKSERERERKRESINYLVAFLFS